MSQQIFDFVKMFLDKHKKFSQVENLRKSW